VRVWRVCRAQSEEGFGSALTRGLRNGYGAANLKFKTDFQSMKLFCGEKEIQPIFPGRIPLTVNVAQFVGEDGRFQLQRRLSLSAGRGEPELQIRQN